MTEIEKIKFNNLILIIKQRGCANVYCDRCYLFEFCKMLPVTLREHINHPHNTFTDESYKKIIDEIYNNDMYKEIRSLLFEELL